MIKKRQKNDKKWQKMIKNDKKLLKTIKNYKNILPSLKEGAKKMILLYKYSPKYVSFILGSSTILKSRSKSIPNNKKVY